LQGFLQEAKTKNISHSHRCRRMCQLTQSNKDSTRQGRWHCKITVAKRIKDSWML